MNLVKGKIGNYAEMMSDATRSRKKPEGQYHHGDLRTALLATALEIVETSGLEGLTLRAVALRLGVSHAAPGYHFPTKTDLVSALAEEGFRLFADALEAGASGDETDRLLRVGQAYLAFARRHPNHYRVMFGPELAGLLSPSPGFVRESNRALAVLTDTSGDRPAGPLLGERALFVWSLVHGLVTLRTGPLLCRLPLEAALELDRQMERVLVQVVRVLDAYPPSTPSPQ